MIRRYLPVMLLAVSSCVAFGQSASPFNGKWKVKWQTEKRQLEADLVIEESGGSWKTFGT